MSEIYDKFVYWTDLIKKEESKLSFVFSKIFNSLKLSLDLLKNEPKRIDQYDLLYKLTTEFNDDMEFEEKTELFLNIYSILKKSKFFELTPDNFETLERIRKTQYHIWNLFDYAYNYNKYVRLYNDRLEFPERKAIAKKYGFKRKSFIFENSNRPPIIIGVAGPSCSGKSTVAKLLKYNYPFKISTIEADMFFRKHTPQTYNGYNNWECEEALMLDKLAICLEQLRNSEPTIIPSAGWTEEFDKVIYPTDIIIVEGFIIFLNKEISKLLDLKIYYELSDENQLKRRLKRNGDNEYDYIVNVVIPHYNKYRAKIRQSTHYIIDGNTEKNKVIDKTRDIINKLNITKNNRQ